MNLKRRRGGAARASFGLTAAKQALLETGLDAVKIQPLASRLNISRTSFYWFFKDRGALLDALLEEWDAKNTGAFADASRRPMPRRSPRPF
jgi:AcrR family transcriptional regulator